MRELYCIIAQHDIMYLPQSIPCPSFPAASYGHLPSFYWRLPHTCLSCVPKWFLNKLLLSKEIDFLTVSETWHHIPACKSPLLIPGLECPYWSQALQHSHYLSRLPFLHPCSESPWLCNSTGTCFSDISNMDPHWIVLGLTLHVLTSFPQRW